MPAPQQLLDSTPIIIGVGQITEQPLALEQCSSPVDLIEAAVLAAADDAGISQRSLAKIDELVLVRGFREFTRNSPEALAQRINASAARCWITPNGGNAPQYLINRYAQAIANGEHSMVLVAGSEAMDTSRRLHKAGIKPDWAQPSDSDPALLYPDRAMASAHEQAQGIVLPSNIYALFENALRQHYGHSIEEHQRALGELFAPFSAAAARSPHAWYPIERSAAEIATATEANRYVGWPYTKYMNAMNQINQSAALLLTSVGHARTLGVAEDQWVYLHGCADVQEKWQVSERVNYHSSPAIKLLGEQALAMANKSIDQIDFVDLYSCFPSAVQIARDELGIATDDPRPLTITGGLPFHGGAGNNYVMNSIAAMVAKLRQHRGKYGLVTANGGFLTKHSAGIYSTAAPLGQWQRREPSDYQPLVDNLAQPPYVEKPSGRAVIETYTVSFDRGNNPEMAIIIGRLGDGSDAMAPRFIAQTTRDDAQMLAMTQQNFIGRSGTVDSSDSINIFHPQNL
jgi:acetyl-CoA C-acetyltransferase